MTHPSLRLALPPLLLLAGILGFARLQGVPFWLACVLASLGLFASLRAIALRAGLPRSSRALAALLRAGLLLTSTALGLTFFEAALAVVEIEVPAALFETPAEGEPLPPGMRADTIFHAPEAGSPLAVSMPPEVLRKAEMMRGAVTMPLAWEHRWIRKVKGEPYQFMWQGVYHVHGPDEFRREVPFPPRTPGRARIIAIGDSYTYGRAIASFWTYPAQLERGLTRGFDVEVLNLGASGLSSEEILGKLRAVLPELEPDLVFYGVCLNDFEPADFEPPMRLAVPIPRKMERHLIRRTRVGRFFSFRYDQLLRNLDVRLDRHDNRLLDLRTRSARFGRDVAEMNALVREAGLPPVVTMVLNMDTSGDERTRQLVEVAEAKLHQAGMAVIESDPFARAFAGRNFGVSRWDPHPNEEANAIWAKMLWQHFGERAELAAYRRPQGAGATP